MMMPERLLAVVEGSQRRWSRKSVGGGRNRACRVSYGHVLDEERTWSLIPCGGGSFFSQLFFNSFYELSPHCLRASHKKVQHALGNPFIPLQCVKFKQYKIGFIYMHMMFSMRTCQLTEKNKGIGWGGGNLDFFLIPIN